MHALSYSQIASQYQALSLTLTLILILILILTLNAFMSVCLHVFSLKQIHKHVHYHSKLIFENEDLNFQDR